MSLDVPGRLGPYEIRARIGAGGMGEVYLAEDTHLKRRVAIKVVTAGSDGTAHKRLVREAQAAAALDHPNICAIYSVSEQDGRAFIVMQYVEGETLAARIRRQRLSISEAVDIAAALADGLAEAHARGIVHRDVKPQNVMITARGQVKILDFGLAKVVDADIADRETATRTLLTQSGAIIGTVPYMSPEQVKGSPLDARTDVFSFGVTLYEMLSGHNPFAADTGVETISAVLTADPPPLAVHGVAAPAGLERVVRRCLNKDRAQRYQTMREVLLALVSIREAAAADYDASPAASRAGVLARSARISRAAAAAGVIAIAGAGFVWYARTPPDERPRSARSVNSPAYELYLRGSMKVGIENRDDNSAAISLLRQAVAADPDFAPARAELARAYGIRAFYFASDAEKKVLTEEAELEVEKALRLDPDLAEAHLSRGLLLWTHHKRFPHEQAAQSYKRALQLNPKLDEARHQLALVYLHIGLLDKAWTEVERALAANPANTMARFRLGVIDLYRGRYEDALEIFNSTPPTTHPPLVAFQKAFALLQLGRLQEAGSIVEEYLRLHPADEGGTVTSVRGLLLARAGRAREAEQTIERAIAIGRAFDHFHHTAYNIGSAYALLGRQGDAIEWLQMAADDGFPCYPLFEHDANLDGLRRNPRFAAFLAQMKTRWKRFDARL